MEVTKKSLWIISEMIEHEDPKENYTPIIECELHEWLKEDIVSFLARCKKNVQDFETIFAMKEEQGNEAKKAWEHCQSSVFKEHDKDVENNFEAWKEWSEILKSIFGEDPGISFRMLTFSLMYVNTITNQEVCNDTIEFALICYGVFPPDMMWQFFQNQADFAPMVKQRLEPMVEEFARSSLSKFILPYFLAIGFEKSLYISSKEPTQIELLTSL